MSFTTGEIYMTAGVSAKAEDDLAFASFLSKSLSRYINCDWGDTCEEDAEMNNQALENGDRIFSVYRLDKTTLWLITEANRSATTILFPYEY